MYISAIKKDITDLMTKPTYEKSNLTLEERISLKNLSERTDIIIHSADKGGKIVIMDRSIYIQEFEKQLENISR